MKSQTFSEAQLGFTTGLTANAVKIFVFVSIMYKKIHLTVVFH